MRSRGGRRKKHKLKHFQQKKKTGVRLVMIVSVRGTTSCLPRVGLQAMRSEAMHGEEADPPGCDQEHEPEVEVQWTRSEVAIQIPHVYILQREFPQSYFARRFPNRKGFRNHGHRLLLGKGEITQDHYPKRSRPKT